MYLIFDYSCICDETVEARTVYYTEKDSQICSKCGEVMTKLLGNPAGIVKGSRNPCPKRS